MEWNEMKLTWVEAQINQFSQIRHYENEFARMGSSIYSLAERQYNTSLRYTRVHTWASRVTLHGWRAVVAAEARNIFKITVNHTGQE